MRIQRRTFIATSCIIAGLGVAALAYANPDTTACVLVQLADLQSLPDGTLVEPGVSAQERTQLHELVAGARARIEATFGTPQARPIVVFFQEPRTFWWLKVNMYGSAKMDGRHTCVIVGPKGRNADVVAHELMHAELADRVGYWRSFTEVPVWFDEGLAMQVDRRPRYALSPSSPGDTNYVRQLTNVGSFLQGSEPQVVRNYASAKIEVANWLSDVGPRSLYGRLQRIANGEPFDAVLPK